MKPTLCNYAFEWTSEFQSITLAVPESVLSAFFREDVISVCQQNINNLYEKFFSRINTLSLTQLKIQLPNVLSPRKCLDF